MFSRRTNVCLFNDKIITARDLIAFNLSGDDKSIHLHALRLERYLCSAKFECFQPCFRAKKAEISEKNPAWLVSPAAFSSNVTLALSPGETISHNSAFDEDLNLPRVQ